MPSPRSLLQPAHRVLTRHPGALIAAARATDALGTHTVSDHLFRVGGGRDAVVVRLPAGRTDLRSRRIAMWSHGDRDLIARALRGGFGAFEPPMPAVYVTEVRAGTGAVYDVGANTGLYALLAAAVGSPAVEAFEPYPPVLELLHRNLALNHGVGRVHVHAEAVGSEEGSATLYVPPPAPNDPVETSASLSPTFKESVAQEVVVPVTTLDAHWSASGRAPVNVVKVDVESREADVLDGAREMLAGARPLVFFELLPAGEPERITALARELDYVDGYLSPTEIVLGGVIEHHPDAWNHVLVPVERVGAFAGRARDIGLVVTLL